MEVEPKRCSTVTRGLSISTVSDQLRRYNSVGVLKSGLKLNIEALKLDYSVSNPSIREALTPLVGEVYVRFEELKDFRVLKSAFDALADSGRVRAELGGLALASAKRSAQEHTALKDVVLAGDFVAGQASSKNTTQGRPVMQWIVSPYHLRVRKSSHNLGSLTSICRKDQNT